VRIQTQDVIKPLETIQEEP
jgi:serine/threonine protein phosphatase PrpC